MNVFSPAFHVVCQGKEALTFLCTSLCNYFLVIPWGGILFVPPVPLLYNSSVWEEAVHFPCVLLAYGNTGTQCVVLTVLHCPAECGKLSSGCKEAPFLNGPFLY